MLKRLAFAVTGIATYAVGIHKGSPELFLIGITVFLIAATSLTSRIAR